jgi:hypothetical protein
MTDPLSLEGLERFAEVAAGHVGPDKIPGLVALVSREEQVHIEALGSLSIGGPPIGQGLRGTHPTGNGVTLPGSATVPPGWSPLPMTCWSLPAPSSLEALRFCPRRPSPR